MTVELIREFLGWGTFINFAVLLIWFLWFILAHDRVYRLHVRWFSLSVERFDAIHYAAMAFYKLCIILFNLVPYIVLVCLLD